MNEVKIRQELESGINLHVVFDCVDSTNTYLKNLCRTQDVADKTVVIAKSQSGGRGRLGRSFLSPNGGIYVSVTFAPVCEADVALRITAAAAVAVCRVLDKYTDEKAQIKWVNDVYLSGKKLCGILTEAVTDAQSGRIKNIIVGIGLNVDGFSDFPADLQEIVTTLAMHTQSLPARETLVCEVLNELCAVADKLADAEIMQEYRSRSFVIGKAVRVIQSAAEADAVVTDIDDEGGLCVTYEDGRTDILRSAEISIRTK